MKLSNLKVGGVLKLDWSGIRAEYIVVSDTIYLEHNVDTKELVYLQINCYRIIYTQYKNTDLFKLNRITPEDVLKDDYVLKAEVTSIPVKDLVLMLHEPNKTEWFNRALQGTMRGQGESLYPRLLKYVGENETYPTIKEL